MLVTFAVTDCTAAKAEEMEKSSLEAMMAGHRPLAMLWAGGFVATLTRRSVHR